MEKFFEIELIIGPMRVRFSCTKLKSHSSLWWGKLRPDRENSDREKIET